MNLSNARIIEWESTEERGFEFTRLVEVAHVARREARGAKFREGGTYYTEEHAAKLGARVVAEFPRPSLAEIVGDAPAFRANILEPRPGEEHLAGVFAYRDRSGGWRVVSESDGSPWSMVYTLESLGRLMLDPASVVPLVAREVVS